MDFSHNFAPIFLWILGKSFSSLNLRFLSHKIGAEIPALFHNTDQHSKRMELMALYKP